MVETSDGLSEGIGEADWCLSVQALSSPGIKEKVDKGLEKLKGLGFEVILPFDICRKHVSKIQFLTYMLDVRHQNSSKISKIPNVNVDTKINNIITRYYVVSINTFRYLI